MAPDDSVRVSPAGIGAASPPPAAFRDHTGATSAAEGAVAGFRKAPGVLLILGGLYFLYSMR